jgi:serine/threonine kinase 16
VKLIKIQPGNVLLTDNNEPVLMDFGSVAEARVNVSNRQQALAVQENADILCTPQYLIVPLLLSFFSLSFLSLPSPFPLSSSIPFSSPSFASLSPLHSLRSTIYRAPELFNVPSECTIDERTDIWSLGCLLYPYIHSYYIDSIIPNHDTYMNHKYHE